VDDAGVSDLVGCVAPRLPYGFSAGDDETFGVPVPQGRRAYAERAGELGDAHGVRGSYVVDGLRGDGLGGLLGQLEFPALGVEPGVCGVEEGEYVRCRLPVCGAQDLLGLDRAGGGCERSISQRGVHVGLGVDPVTGWGTTCGGQYAVLLEVAHLLYRVPGPSCDVDRAQSRGLATFHSATSAFSRQSLHKHINEMLEHMGVDEIIKFLHGLGGVLVLRPAPSDGSPEISWGDTFFYYAPDGVVPKTQPFATIVTKDYPGDEGSRLNRPGTFRLNFFAGKEAFVNWTGHQPREPATRDVDPSATDTVIAHPVYGSVGWLAVVNPGSRTDTAIRELIRTAHHLARNRYQRRARSTPRRD
jgi:hypothetical protein